MKLPSQTSSSPVQRYLAPLISALLLASLALVVANPVRAATITVTNDDDSGTGSLRQALADAVDGDTIEFHADLDGSTITLTTGQLVVDDDITIAGPGADKLAISGNDVSRVIWVNTGNTVTVSGLTIVDGGVADDGAGMIIDRATVTVVASAFVSNNAGGVGGAIGNFGYSGSASSLTVVDSTLSGNSAGSGAGIYSKGEGVASTLTVMNSTISGNTAVSFGGGILTHHDSSSATVIKNSTIANNTAPGSGPGLRLEGAGSSAHIGSTILADVTVISGATVTSLGYNVAVDSPAGLGTSTHDILDADPKLNPLADNGGSTETHKLQADSPALDQGKNFDALASDQRGAGFGRTYDDAGIANPTGGDGTDIGAYENGRPVADSQGPVATDEDSHVDITLEASDGDDDGLSFSIVDSPSKGTLGTIATPDCAALSDCTSVVRYTPDADANGADSFTFRVNDGAADSVAATVSINIVSVNDAPTGANNTVTTPQDTGHVFAVGDFGYSDPGDEPPDNLLSIKVTTLPGAGALTNDGSALAAGDSVSGSDIVDGDLVFTPANGASGDPYTSFSFQVQDDGGTNDGGADLDATARTMTINVTPGDPPPADTINPTTTDVTVALREGGQANSAPITIGWIAIDETTESAELAHRLQVRRRVSSGWSAWTTIAMVAGVDSTARGINTLGRRVQYRVRSVDEAGNWSTPSRSSTIRANLHQPGKLTYTGAWSAAQMASATNGRVRRSSTAGSTATLAFSGNGAAAIMPAGPAQGTVEVCIDFGTVDQECKTVDLATFSPSGARRLVAAFTGLANGNHTLRVRVVAGQINLDAVVVSRP